MGKGSSRRKEDTEKIRSNWDIAFGKKDAYAKECETVALFGKDSRSEAEKKLDSMLIEQGSLDQGTEDYWILYRIAVKLIEGEKK